MRYVGWINGQPDDRRRLKWLGVRGRCYYNPKYGDFRRCVIDDEVKERLKKEWPDFWEGAFREIKEVMP